MSPRQHEQALRVQVARQVAHWHAATVGLDDPDNFAAPAAWDALERYLGFTLRGYLSGSVQRLKRQAAALRADLARARTLDELEQLRRRVVRFRYRFLQTETVLDFFGDAVCTRASPRLAALLAACDKMAVRSMRQLLDQLDKPTPPALTYIDKGLGAAILWAGQRLWDGGSLNPVAAIKVVRHNLLRPALIHEAGHQFAHISGWTQELASHFRHELGEDPEVAGAWADWASEVTADTFAFVHTGYAAVAALHDVLAGETQSVFRRLPLDPHPVAYLRVLFGAQLCRTSFGAGPWDDLAEAWIRAHPLAGAPPDSRQLMVGSLRRLPHIVDICLAARMQAFGGLALTALIDPARVSPHALARLQEEAGDALYRSPHWLEKECVRLMALDGLRAATTPERAPQFAEQQEHWMLRLGGSIQQAAA